MSSVAGSSLRVHLQQLRWCGIYRLGSREPLHRLHRTLSLTLVTAYISQMCIYAYQERNDMDKLARVMLLLLVYISSLAKQVVFVVDADRIDRMIASMDDPLYNQSGPQHQHHRLLVVTARVAGWFARAYSLVAVVVATFWIIIPIMHYARGQPVDFYFWVYIEYSGPFGFTLISSYSYYMMIVVAVGNTSMDALIATVLNQCKVQLTILRMMDLLQDIFGSAILVQFGVGGWVLCFCAYRVVSLNVLSVEFASITLFFCCILTELFLYCYYGNEVTVESDRVVESLYAMEWRHTPARFRRSLVVVMERAKRPLRPVAGRIIPLSLDTYVKIIKSSYSFYAVLRQTK